MQECDLHLQPKLGCTETVFYLEGGRCWGSSIHEGRCLKWTLMSATGLFLVPTLITWLEKPICLCKNTVYERAELFHSPWVLLPASWAWKQIDDGNDEWWGGGKNKRKKTRKWWFCLLDGEDCWVHLPGELSKVHIDTSMVELGQKAWLLLWAQHVGRLALWGKPNFSGDSDLSLFACSYFTGSWFMEKTVSSRISGRCSCRRERFNRHFECHIAVKAAEVCCVVGGMGVTLGDPPKCFYHLRGLGQAFSSFCSFNGGGG